MPARLRLRFAALALAAVVVAGALGPSTLGAGAQTAGPDRVVTYSVAVRGSISADVEAFAAHAAGTFADPRGWSLGGAVAFQRVPSGGDFTLWLAEASTVPSFSSSCSSTWSCRVGRNVIINETRWRTSTPTWPHGLDAYQHYVVVHELGHWLGLGHASCPGAGQAAPVMMQQSKGSGGCLFNVWPLEGERQAAGRNLGVAVRPIVPPCTDSTTDPATANRFVAAAYRTILGRTADPGGLAGWSAQLQAGVCRQAVLRSLLGSAEGRGVTVDRFYRELLLRGADPGGRAAFVAALGGGRSWAALAADLLGSTEAWLLGGGTADGFATLVYQRLLGRAPEPAGRAWLAALVAQRGQRAGVEAVWWSTEGVHRRVERAYRDVLGRGADPAGLAGHAEIARRAGDAAVVVALAASPEYLAKA